MKNKRNRIFKMIFNVFFVLVIVLASISLFKSYTFYPVVISGNSMSPTLKNGDFGYANKTYKAKHEIKRNQILLFHPSVDLNSIYVKRVIALPKETFYLSSLNGDIYINGKLIEQNYIDENVKKSTVNTARKDILDREITLAKDEYFVLGDNRSNSYDSAHGIGLVKQNTIVAVLESIVAKCSEGSFSDTSLKVCSSSNRKTLPINEWKYF